MKIKNPYLLTLIMLLTLTWSAPAQAEDDFQYWSWYTFKLVDTKHIDWKIYAETRLANDWQDNSLNFVSSRFTFDYIDNLQFGLNYSYLDVKGKNTLSGDSEFKYHHRAEVEVNPSWWYKDIMKITNRNRVEFRWIEGKGSYNTRSRHRFNFSFPIKKEWPLKSVYFNSEFFYNHAENDFDENRTVPIGLKWKLSEDVNLSTFWMIQTKLSNNSWFARQALGTHLMVNF